MKRSPGLWRWLSEAESEVPMTHNQPPPAYFGVQVQSLHLEIQYKRCLLPLKRSQYPASVFTFIKPASPSSNQLHLCPVNLSSTTILNTFQNHTKWLPLPHLFPPSPWLSLPPPLLLPQLSWQQDNRQLLQWWTSLFTRQHSRAPKTSAGSASTQSMCLPTNLLLTTVQFATQPPTFMSFK